MPSVASQNTTELRPIELSPLPAQPLVSILVSNYNYGRFIADSIQSALDQTYSHFELIICDDGSTDDSVRIVDQFARRDSRVRLIAKENGGQASGFNAAFAACQGEIIALLDSDDIFLPHKLERVVADFQAHPDAGFGVHRIIRMSVDLRRQGVWPMSDPLPCGWHGAEMLLDGGVLPYTPPTSGLSLRRQVAERLFPLPLQEPLVSCPDQLLCRLAPFLTNVTREDEALSAYRLHGNNNYGPDRVTAESFKRQMVFSEALWAGQKRFLATIDPGLAEDFQPLSNNGYTAQITYLHARFAKDPDVRRHYDRFIASLTGPGARHVWFWKISIYLPLPVFDFCVNLLIRQSWLKQFVARLKRMS